MRGEHVEKGSSHTLLQSLRNELEQATFVLAEQLAEEQPEKAQFLQSKKMYKERIQKEVKSSLDSLEKTLQKQLGE